MTLAMCARVIFPAREGREELIIRKVSSVRIESSWRQLTDTAEIVLPRNVTFFDRENVKEVFRRGDEVRIKLGYDDVLITEFRGYVTEVSANIPILIKCQDEMFQIKPLPVNFSSPGITLENLLKQLLLDVEKDVLEGCDLGAVRFSKTNMGEVLEKLQNDMKLYSYITPTEKTLVSGKIYSDDTGGPTHYFDLERNVVSNDLDYKNREDIRVKVNGTAVSGGKKLEYSYGDEQPDKTIDWQFNVTSQASLESEVKRLFEANKKDGFSGSFQAFGIPSVQHGEKVELRSSLYPDREGTYYVEGVNKSFDEGGYRQEILLGNRYESRK